MDFELFVGWIARAIGRGVDVEDDAERWFAGLVDAHPDAPFVVAYWGEARRRIAIQKYGAGFGSPTARRMDRAAEKFEEAHRMAPKIPYFAARVQGIRFTAATALARTDEGDRRIAEAMEWWEKAVLYYREHAPWALEPGPLDDPEPLARWAGESVRENGRAEGGT